MEIRQIIEQNPWWEDREKIKEDEKVKEALAKKNKMFFPFEEGNFLLVGPRQVGKTTYLKLSILGLINKGVSPKKLLYFSCEPLNNFEEILEIVRFSDSLVEGEKYLFFDEVTFVKDWQKAIKYLLDSPLGRQKNLYISGSSSLALKKETFPGRKIETKEFLPLSFNKFSKIFVSPNLKKEIKKAKARINIFNTKEIFQKAKILIFFFNEISRLFDFYLKCGGFPRSIYELMEGKGIKEETYEIYWKWLVSDIAKIERSEKITRSVLIGVLKNYSSRFSMNSIARETEIGSHVTVREYLEILEDLFVLRNIFPIDLKRKVEVFRRMRKVYFTDPFLFLVFKKMLTGQSSEIKDIPKIVEGMVGEHLIRNFEKIFYFSNKKEIDFVLNNFGIEVKWQSKVSLRDFPKIDLKNKIILSKSDFEYSKKDNLLILPAAVFLLLLE